MVAVTETFIELFKRQPNEADKIRLMSVQKALRLPDDDPLWTVLIALDYYQKLYEEAPEKIVAATHEAARTTITAAEAVTTERLVSGALAIANERMERDRASQWPLVVVCVVLSVVLVGLGVSFWSAAQQFQSREVATITNYKNQLASAKEKFQAREVEIVKDYENKLATTKDQFDNTLAVRTREIQEAAASQLAKDEAVLDNEKAVLDWVRQYQGLYTDKDFQNRVDFVAKNPVFADALRPLTTMQIDNLLRIITKADRWRGVLSAEKQPWPCFSVRKPTGRGNREANICQVGLDGDIVLANAVGHGNAAPHKISPKRPPTPKIKP